MERSSALADVERPEIRKTKATTQVLMLDGEETAIGGLFINEETNIRKGIPFLKDLPWWVLGLRYLTGYDSKEVVKKEVIILVKIEIRKANGIIHKARANFTVVAICNASLPYLLAAPTTELAS